MVSPRRLTLVVAIAALLLAGAGAAGAGCASADSEPIFNYDAGVVSDADAEAEPPPTFTDDAGTGFHILPLPIPKTCTEAADRRSYTGCEYFPVVTLNPVYEKFDFAVAVSNPQIKDAHVTVTGGALTAPVTVTVSPSAVATIPLPWVAALKGPAFDVNTVASDPGPSRLVAGGAYHLVSDLPVSAYQFNALEYEIPVDPSCPGYGEAGAGPHCFSFSNDASLLLPTTALGKDYAVLAWPSFSVVPGFFAVVATQDQTHVTVYPADTLQGVPGVGPAKMERGEQFTYVLNRGDVLEGFSALPGGSGYGPDLTGTILRADLPIAVHAGHGCTFIPQDKKACDHLESSMFPIETLGTDYIVSMPITPHGEHVRVRVLATDDNTTVQAYPDTAGFPLYPAGVVLNQGEFFEFEIDQTVGLDADGRIEVAEYMLGEFANVSVADGGTPNPDLGDPSESMVVPVSQFRTSYNFLAPSTYAQNWIDVIGVPYSQFTLDGVTYNGAVNPKGGSAVLGYYTIARLPLTADGGGPEGHTITSDYALGIVVYGYGSRTSYMYPGGLDLNLLPLPPSK